MPSAKTPHPHRHRRRATGLALAATIIVGAAPAHAFPTGSLGTGSGDPGGPRGAPPGIPAPRTNAGPNTG